MAKAVTSYKDKQLRIAQFIRNRHSKQEKDQFRKVVETDAKLRCFIYSGEPSHLFEIVKDNDPPYVATPRGGGLVEVTGTGKQEERIFKSGSCGVTWHTGVGNKLKK